MQLPIKFKLKPYKWQREAIKLGLENKNFAIFAEQGTGKTGAAVNIYRCLCNEKKRVRSCLILSPLVTLENWRDEFKKHSNVPDRDVIVLKGTGKKKLKTFQQTSNNGKRQRVYITNYESLLNKELYQALTLYAPEIFIADESHYLKSHKSKRSKLARDLADRSVRRYIMTGTPILNGADDIFMQYRVLDGGNTFGKSYFAFRAKYMEDLNEGWKHKQNYFPNYVTKRTSLSELNQKMYRKAIRVLKSECLDLPPLIKQTIKVDMGPEQKKAYKEMERDCIAFVEENQDNPAVANIALTKMLRLQQIASGFVTRDDGSTHEFDKVPRLKETKELLESLTVNNKVILWCSFKHNYKQLSKICDELGIKYGMLTGEQSLDEKQAAMNSFRDDEEMQVMIANRRAGGIGVNLVAAAYSIVYSRNFSLSDELQSEARNHRGGSQMHEKIVKIDLCCEGTVDEATTIALNDKKDISSNLLDLLRTK